jgi:transketolase
MIGVAAGLAFTGYTPFTATYATFSPGRSWEQIRISVALSQANVKIIGGHAGVATGLNGPSHQATEDLALMRILPHMTVLIPADYEQAKASIEAAYTQVGPVYIRSIRPSTACFTKPRIFDVGRAYVYRSGGDVTLAACGSQVYDALVIAEQLTTIGVAAEVINVSSLKPLDETTILQSVQKTGRIVTIEDHLIAGGLGSAIAELLASTTPSPLLRLGVEDRFGISAPLDVVYQAVGLDRESLMARIMAFVR